MGTNLEDSKLALRTQVRQAVSAMPEAQRVVAAGQARSRLKEQPLWKSAQSILFFAPLPEELDIWPLLAEGLSLGKIVALPRFVAETKSYAACRVRNLEQDLRSGQFGIREPGDRCPDLSLNRLDLILVPGVAFDLHGRRLGRGKGFYDQLLAVAGGKSCGVAFDEQIVTNIPVEPHDIYVNCILTPTRWIEF